MGNLFETKDFSDRKYAKGGQLLKTRDWEYKYDDFGNLVRKKDKHGATWRYEWNAAGMLERVMRPDAREISFKYDALGRRIEKRNGTVVTRWVWDGNVPLHEMVSQFWQKYDKDKHQEYWDEEKRPTVTWIFEEGTFVPTAKLTGKKKLSIVSNYMGTPEAMFREDGEKVWSCELNSYGKIRSYQGEYKTECPFRYQGQYHDGDTGLYYNRFRYYSPDEGMYISQDPIRLRGGSNLYSYVYDINGWVDQFGLKHNALWEHQGSDGTVKGSGSEVSGGTGKPHPTWTEQAASHTEPKILNTISQNNNVQTGDTIIIVGERNPCNGNANALGTMGCQKVMNDYAQDKGVTIKYYSLEDDSVYTFAEGEEPKKEPCNS